MAEDDGFIGRLQSLIGQGSARDFARKAGISDSTLRSVLKGTRPSIDVALAIAKGHAVSIAWLLEGKGHQRMPTGRSLGGSPELAEAWGATMYLLKDVLVRVYQDEGIALPPAAFIDDLIKRYALLLPMLSDPHDVEEMKAMLPAVEYRLRKELRDAKAAPGTGKREVS